MSKVIKTLAYPLTWGWWQCFGPSRGKEGWELVTKKNPAHCSYKGSEMLSLFPVAFLPGDTVPHAQTRNFSTQILPDTKSQIGRAGGGHLASRYQTRTASSQTHQKQNLQDEEILIGFKPLLQWPSDSKRPCPGSHRVTVVVNLELRLLTLPQGLSSGHKLSRLHLA